MTAIGEPTAPLPRRAWVAESFLVLGVSLGASGIYSVLTIIDRLTVHRALSSQTSTLNNSVTPDRPWLDLAYQLVGIGLGVVPALLAIHLLSSDEPGARHAIGFDLGKPLQDLGRGALIAAAVGIPGLGLYAAARALGLNTTVAAANLTDHWWAVPVLILAAGQNAVLEEVVMIGYLYRRWLGAGWSLPRVMILSALIRGSYHLYQGFGGFLGNAAMGLIFGWVYTRTKRVAPLVVAHTLLDVVAFVGYTLLKGHLSWI
ncbi:MAG: type II CAAX endopeptidase family protein [Nostocoides sp.]